MDDARANDDIDRHPPVYSADEVRQGEIILRTRRRRLLFIAGLIGLVIVAALVGIRIWP
jgi:hypothetical protein